jgi:hypothetical protein
VPVEEPSTASQTDISRYRAKNSDLILLAIAAFIGEAMADLLAVRSRSMLLSRLAKMLPAMN